MEKILGLIKNKFILIILLFTFVYSQEKVTLQLKWLHQFQFAGYYVAKEKGFYSEVGLEVEIKERNLQVNNVEQVINNEAEYGIADTALLLYKMKEKPVVIVAPIFQHSPNVLISLKSSDILSPYDLDDKNISVFANDTDSLTILAMLKKLEIQPNFLAQRENNDYQKLIDKEIDVISSYLSNEPFYFKEINMDINIINPRNYGFDLYGDILFTNKNEALNHPERVEKFKKATLKGWEYALNHKEEVIELIHKKYNNKKSIEHLKYEANIIAEMIDKENIPLGTINEGRLKYITDLYQDFGLLKNSLNIKEIIFQRFRNDLDLTAEELNYLENKKELTYCIDPNWLPYEKNLEQKHVGITADYFKIFQKELGVSFHFIPTSSWSETLSFVRDKKCDILSLAAVNEERKKFVNFTKSYIQSPLVVATKTDEIFISDISDIKDKKVGIVKGYSFIKSLKEKYPDINIVEVKDIDDGLEKVKNKELYGFIDTLTTIAYSIQHEYATQLKISGKFDETLDLSLGTRIDEPILNSIFNKVIDGITFDDKQMIFNKWTSVKVEEKTDYKEVLLWVLGTIFVFGIVLFIVIDANMKLSEEIKKREEVEKRLKSFNKLIDEHIISSSTDLKGNITEVSSAFCEISKYSREELIGQNQNIVRHPDMPKEVYEDLWRTVRENRVWTGEIKNIAKDKTVYWVNTTISPKFNEFNEKIGYVSIRHDITDKKIIEEISIMDGLTNIYNRRFFNDFSPKFVNGSKRENDYISFLVIDVDYFKQYNDTYGHIMGDEVLKKVAGVLKNHTSRLDDYCFRLGGEEFGILFKSKDKNKAFEFSKFILKDIEELKIEHKNSKVSSYITVSMGLFSDFANNINNIDEMYKKADEMLYLAKESGRNRVIC